MNTPYHKWAPAQPTALVYDPNGNVVQSGEPGLTQYAEVAARFHAVALGHVSPPASAATWAFDHADAFFAELAKRMQP